MKTYYNTNNLQGDQLREAVVRAKNQGKAILLIYLNSRRPFSPSQILRLTEKAGKKWPITSLRRAITNLCSAGHLVKCTDTVLGVYGTPEHTWQINAVKYPTQQGEQPSLFDRAA